jgi:hypothetical protein
MMILHPTSHPTMPMQRTAQARFYVDGVLPMTVFQIGAYCAGEVQVYRWGVLCSALSYSIGYKCSR